MSEERHGHHPTIGRRATYRSAPLVELGGGAIFYPLPTTGFTPSESPPAPRRFRFLRTRYWILTWRPPRQTDYLDISNFGDSFLESDKRNFFCYVTKVTNYAIVQRAFPLASYSILDCIYIFIFSC